MMTGPTPTPTQADATPIVAVLAPLPGTLDLPEALVRVLDGPLAALPGPARRPHALRTAAGATVLVPMFSDRVDAEMLDAAGPLLRGVCAYAVGYDNIDLPACAARGVCVTNTPDAVTEGTANLALGLLLACTRRIVAADRFVRSGRFEREGNGFPTGWMGQDLTGRTLCIVGAGRIGLALAHRCRALGMRTTYVARTRHLEFELAPIAAQRVDLDSGLREADVVSLHTPLSPQTRHLIAAPQLAAMKPTAVLLNTARGPVVDEEALVAALQRGTIAAAGLDVFEHEPRVHPGLLALDNAVLTPHIGSAEDRWRREMTAIVGANARAIIAGLRPPNAVA